MVAPVRKEIDGHMLTQFEELFVQHPDAIVNPRKAAIDCGMPPARAEKRAYELRAKFRDLIVANVRTRLDNEGATDGRLLKELGALALYNVVDAYETIEIELDNGEKREVTVLKDIKKLPEELQRAVKKVEFDSIVTGNKVLAFVSKIEFHDKLGALRDYLKVRGIYEPEGGRKPPAQDRSPLEDLTVEELEEIAKIHEHAQRRLAKRASAMRDSTAIEGELAPQRLAARPAPEEDHE